jgi:hypothetical protein
MAFNVDRCFYSTDSDAAQLFSQQLDQVVGIDCSHGGYLSVVGWLDRAG